MKLRGHPFIVGLGVFCVAVIVLVLVWDWNWLRPLVEHEASTALGRQVKVKYFRVLHLWSRDPLVVLDGISIANPPDFPQGSEFGTIARLSVRIDALALFHSRGHSFVIPQIAIEHPNGDLRPGAKGSPNWAFVLPSGSGGAPPEIGAVVISDGTFRVADPKLKADLTIAVHTEHAGKGSEDRLMATAKGTYAGQPTTASFVGGAVLSLRDPKDPYPIDLKATSGQTRIAVKGTIEDPMHFRGAKIELDLAGKDLAELYPLIGIPLAPTPPYTLKGHLDYADKKIRFDNFAGTVGQSDLRGNFVVNPGKARPEVTADLSSRRVVMSDLGGFIGAAPGNKDALQLSSKQQQEHAKHAADPNFLPDTPISLPEIRAADFDVHYKGEHIDGAFMPLDNLTAHLTIKDGNITIHPLEFGIGKGTIASNIALDARKKLVHAKADIDFRQVDFQRIMQSTHMFEGAGVIGGRAEIEGNGNSLAQMLADGNGNIKLFMTGGDVSALLVDLAGLDLGRSVLSALGLPDKTTINCMVSDFELQNGILNTRTFLFDTKEADLVGTGTVSFHNETIDYQIKQEPKHFSIGAFHAPIDITGLLKSPSIKPDPKVLAERGGAAVALAILTPLAALLPTIQLALGQKNNCSELAQPAAHSGGATPESAPENQRTQRQP
jgi:hypothetical protein